MLGSEGPQTLDQLSGRLPFPLGQVESVLQELEMRNLVSIGFFTQTDEGEFILRVDEYRITGGSVEVVDYRTLQTLLLQKSFTEFSEPSEAIKSLALIQRRDSLQGQELQIQRLERLQATLTFTTEDYCTTG